MTTVIDQSHGPLVGRPAPPFSSDSFDPRFPDRTDSRVSLDDYKGRWLVLFWYPLDFTTVCPTEINAFSDRIEDFNVLECAVLGASTDSVYSHRAWTKISRQDNGIGGLAFPLLSDQTHSVSQSYEVFLGASGIALRGTFIIDPSGIIQYMALHNLDIGRSVDETLRVLQALQSGGICGSDWKPGDGTLA
jgi:peroxiredoxin 2/4